MSFESHRCVFRLALARTLIGHVTLASWCLRCGPWGESVDWAEARAAVKFASWQLIHRFQLHSTQGPRRKEFLRALTADADNSIVEIDKQNNEETSAPIQ